MAQENENQFAFLTESSNFNKAGSGNYDPWIMDSVISHYYPINEGHVHNNSTEYSGTITTARSKTLQIIAKGINETYGQVKLVTKIWRSLLSVGKLTKNPSLRLTFIVDGCSILSNAKFIETGTKGEENV